MNLLRNREVEYKKEVYKKSKGKVFPLQAGCGPEDG